MRQFTIVLLSFVVVACATTGETPIADLAKPQVERMAGISPDIGERSTVNVGQTIIQDYDYYAYKLPDFYHVESAVDVMVGPMMSVKVDPQTKLFRVRGDKFCIDNYGKDCLYDSDGDGAFERASSKPGYILFDKELSSPISYYSASGKTVMADAGGYKRELIYQGRDGDTLRVAYREFVDNLARPAFSQDLTYPIDRENTSKIVFRDVIINVYEVAETAITYSVTEGKF